MLHLLSRWTLPPAILLAALAAYRALAIYPTGPAIVLPRNEPVLIEPLYSDPRVITDDQLYEVLSRVLPPADPVNTNNFVHALRLWGPTAQFTDPDIPSGNELHQYFLNDSVFRRFAGDQTPPIFSRGRRGLEVRGYDDHATHQTTSSYHTDDLLATLAESGTPLDTPLHIRDGDATVRQLLTDSLAGYHLERLEYEWTAIAYARYVFPERQWRNRFGERITVDALIAEIVGHPPDLGPCNGLHRLEALAVLHQANEQHGALRPRTRQLVVHYMKAASSALVAAQSPEGYWTRTWPQGQSVPQAAGTSISTTPTLHDKLLVTGHHLEWLAMAPEEIQPPRETIIRAAQWLTRTLLEMDEKQILAAYGPYTHAARALCLWRGTEAAQFWKSHEPANDAQRSTVR